MEDILAVDTLPADPQHPLVCFDETSKQLVSETRQLLPAAPRHAARYDYEYVRKGVSNLFMFFAPLLNWRHVKVTAQRTKLDFAQCRRELVDVHFPNASQIRLVMDNLNTPTLAALYEVFPPAEAKRIADQVEIHDTPKHGSWLNRAEIERSGLATQCLDRRIPDPMILEREVAAWMEARNVRGATVNWRFTTDDARIKLKRLDPSI
jgi:hypothetical protein